MQWRRVPAVAFGNAWTGGGEHGGGRSLIVLWLEGCVTGLLPFERNAAGFVAAVGAAYSIPLTVGGMDMHALDHRVQPEIPLANLRLYASPVASCDPTAEGGERWARTSAPTRATY